MSYELTPKFEKELYTFFDWANSSGDYIIYDKDNNQLKWSRNLLMTFSETPRKKLDGFLKGVFKLYTIQNRQNDIIYTYINIINAYKEFKTPVKNNINITDKNIDNLCDSFQLTLNVDENTNDCQDIKINHDLDTSKTWWLCNLEYTTQQLVNVFGDPLLTGNKDTNHRYEWKFVFDNHIFSIYDWKFDNIDFSDINFKEADWFLCGNSNKYNKIIIKILDNMILK